AKSLRAARSGHRRRAPSEGMKRLYVALLWFIVLTAPFWPQRGDVEARHGINGYGYYQITAYFPTGYRTATGTITHWGELAVDPSVIPLGSWVHIEGIGTFRAEDTGGAVLGRHLDVLVYTWSEAYRVQG